MTPIENPECPRGCGVQMERVGREFVCNCCDKVVPIRDKRPEPKTDISGVVMDDDG